MKNKGFTLIEILIVIVIIGILSTIAIPQFTDNFKKARDAERRSAVKIISNIIVANQIMKDSVDYSIAGGKSGLATELNKQGYNIPSGIDDDLCYVYGYESTNYNEFFIAIGLESTGGGSITVSGTINGVVEANSITATIPILADTFCANNVTKISELDTAIAPSTYDFVIF